MPQWITLLTLAIVAWLVLSVGGGLLVGQLLRSVARHVPHLASLQSQLGPVNEIEHGRALSETLPARI